MARFVFFVCLVVAASSFVAASSGDFEEMVDDHRIINGEDADIEDFPYTLFLYTTTEQGGFAMCCTSVLISEDWALTAAHCVNKIDEKNVRLHTNSSRISGGVVGRGHYVSKKIVHPLYMEDECGVTADYDIALLKVNPPFVLGPGTMPVDLPDQDEAFEVGVNGTVTGWGTKDGSPNKPSSVLQKVTLAVADQEQCVTLFANAPAPTQGEVTPRMLCAEGEGSGCVGDSGGPFVVDDRLVGLVSWGADGCVGYPNVFTRVAFFRDWLKENAGV